MKKASVAIRHKLNTRQRVGVGTSYHFLLGVVRNTVKSALEKNGVAGLFEAKNQNKRFEPKKFEANKGETEALASVRPTLLRW